MTDSGKSKRDVDAAEEEFRHLSSLSTKTRLACIAIEDRIRAAKAEREWADAERLELELKGARLRDASARSREGKAQSRWQTMKWRAR